MGCEPFPFISCEYILSAAGSQSLSREWRMSFAITALCKPCFAPSRSQQLMHPIPQILCNRRRRNQRCRWHLLAFASLHSRHIILSAAYSRISRSVSTNPGKCPPGHAGWIRQVRHVFRSWCHALPHTQHALPHPDVVYVAVIFPRWRALASVVRRVAFPPV